MSGELVELMIVKRLVVEEFVSRLRTQGGEPV
jgi:hypothetical protein